MFRIRKLIPFLLCVIMLIPIIGCSEAENTAINSASLPDVSQYSKPKFDTEPPISESSFSETSESVIEYSNMPKTIDGLLANSYSFDKNSYIKYESCLGEANCVKMYPDSSHTMHTDSDSVYAKLYEEYSNTVIYNAEPPEHVLIYEGEYEEFSRINDSFYIYTGTEIILISVDKSQTEIRLIYSPAGNISNIHFTPNLIYIVEDGMLKVMLPDGSDIREITFVGETVEFKPITTTKSRFVKVYYGDYQLTQQDINTVFDYYYSMCEELISIGREDGIELFEDELEKMFYWEYYTLDIISLQIEKVNDTEYYKFR